jgi:TPR repeat protein
LKDSEAMYRLGKKYETGDGIPSSFPQAAVWYEQAAKYDHVVAKRELKGIRGY